LTAEGVFASSAETVDGESFALGASMRLARSRAYLEAIACKAVLRPLPMLSASIRREPGSDAPGLIGVLAPARRPKARG
jgi:predicted TPR repeat methyltransferase